MKKTVVDPADARPSLVPLTRFGREIGRTPSTLWRWRKLGWIDIINVAGKCYISTAEIERFNARAVAGEFAQSPIVPLRTKEVVA